jgi:neurocan core protein
MNDVGEDSDTIALNIFLKPKIKTIGNLTRNKDADVELPCEYSGDGDMTAYWMFKGETMTAPAVSEDLDQNTAGDRVYTRVEEGDGRETLILHIGGLTLEDADEYQCHVSNAAGADVERVFLSITHSPVILERSDAKVRSFVGHEAKMSCEVESVPPPVWTWYHEGNTLSSDGVKFFIENSRTGYLSTLRVVTSEESDFGEFSCFADNGVPRPVTENFSVIKVVTPPIPDGLSVQESRPNYADIDIRNFDLLEEERKPMNITFYYAREDTYNSILLDGPFDWFLTAEKATLNWEDGVTEYRLSNLKPETTYVIMATASNEAGTSPITSNTFFYSTSAPREPAVPVFLTESESVCESSCEIRWSEPNNHGSGILRYRVAYAPVEMDEEGDNPRETGVREEETVASHEHSLTLFHLQADTFYQFEIRAENDIGQSQPSLLIVKTSRYGWPSGGVSTGGIVVIVIVILIVIIVLVDISCYYVNHCGVIMSICINCCGKTPPDVKAKEIAMEEGHRSDDKTPLKDEKEVEGHANETTPMIDGGSVEKKDTTV